MIGPWNFPLHLSTRTVAPALALGNTVVINTNSSGNTSRLQVSGSPAALGIPTVGIGSGEHCDGQILVTHDLIGLFPWFTPKFVSPEARVGEEIRRAARAFIEQTRAGSKS